MRSASIYWEVGVEIGAENGVEIGVEIGAENGVEIGVGVRAETTALIKGRIKSEVTAAFGAEIKAELRAAVQSEIRPSELRCGPSGELSEEPSHREKSGHRGIRSRDRSSKRNSASQELPNKPMIGSTIQFGSYREHDLSRFV